MNNARNPILVIEDEPSVIAYLRAVLERSGYTVTAVERGVDALALLAEGEYHGIISDMRTPGGVDGADVYAWLQKHRPNLAQRLLFITGDIASAETAATLRNTGAPYIEKPFRVQQLISAVQENFGPLND
jgi:CheY-like chemotaxis protein